jgi:hypothetical protein
MDMKQILIFTLCCTLLMLPLSACSGTLTVEPDPHNPKLHGQVVRFTVPMVYMELTEKDLGEYPHKEVSIGRILIPERKIHSPYNISDTNVINKIKENMLFTIVESYWIRQDWFSREFAPDVHRILIKDENGVLSAALMSILFDSDKPEIGR